MAKIPKINPFEGIAYTLSKFLSIAHLEPHSGNIFNNNILKGLSHEIFTLIYWLDGFI
jgi:hypothetical protein